MKNASLVVVVMLLIAIALLGIVWLIGSANVKTDAGHTGYVTQGAIFGAKKYIGIQMGPVSSGRHWLYEVTNVDIRLQTYSERFEVMSADNLLLRFNSHIVMQPIDAQVKKIVELYGGSDWYKRFVKEPFRNAVYEAVAGQKALDAKSKREEIAKKAFSIFSGYIKDKPFKIQKLVVGTIQLPDVVKKAQETKISMETVLEQKKFEIDIAKKDAEKRIEQAKGIAEAQKIINATLTDKYLQHEAIEAQLAMAASPNHTTVYIPVGNNGIPIVKTTR